MSDEGVDLDDVPDPIGQESGDTDPLGLDRKSHPVSESQRLSQQLGLNLRRVKSEDIKGELASEHARQVLQDDLETLYQDDLNVSDPPDSIEAFENRVTLRNLASLATRFGAPAEILFEPRKVVIEATAAESESFDSGPFESFLSDQTAPAEPTRAKKAIDRMVAYGQPAEQFLAIVADDESVHPEIAEYALDALDELQEAKSEPDSLFDALRAYFTGGEP